VVTADFGSRAITLGRGKSCVVEFQRDIKDVLVADPKTANAVIRSSRRAYIIANTTGATNIVFFDAEGRLMASLDITVGRDVSIIRTTIRKLIPDADVNVESIGDGIILTGTVASQAEAQQAYDIASHFVAPGDAFSGGSSSGSGVGGGCGGTGIGSGGGMSMSVSSSSSGLPSAQALSGASS